MIKETWSQFAERVKPAHGQKFKDIYGNEWCYWCNGFFNLMPKMDVSIQASDSPISAGNFIPCSLVDAIENVEKPKLKKITFYCYINTVGFYWRNDVDLYETQALDESGNRITKEIWVE